jgi:hypothetical protein
MARVRPFAVGVALLVLTLGLIALNALEHPRPAPHAPSSLSLIRLVLGLPVVLFAPGYFLVPRLFRRDVAAPGSKDADAIDPGWTLLAALAVNLGFHVVHFNVLRVLNLPIRWPALLAITAVECAVGLWLMRRWHPELRFAPWGPELRRAFGAVCALLVAFTVWAAPHLLRDGSWYFFNPAIDYGWEATIDRDAVAVSWADQTFDEGTVRTTTEATLQLRVANQAESPQSVPLIVAVHAPVGTRVELTAGDRRLGGETIANLAPTGQDGPLVERYWEWGTAALVAHMRPPPGTGATLDLVIQRPAGETEPSEVGVVGWSRLSMGELLDALSMGGHHHMPPYQLLNVTENIRWAEEVAGDFALAGRSPDGKSTLHQPPTWTYLYAPARELLSDQTVSAGALLLAILLGIATAGLLGIRDEGSAIPAALGAVLGLGVMQHGRLMVVDGSLNFPDSMYAMALVVSVVALCSGRVRVFVAWALLAATLRYPGAVVIALAGFTLLALDEQKRRRITHALVRFGFGIALFCGVMLLIGLATRKLDVWLFALYFETIPEHFNNNPEALPMLQRPVEFVKLWALFGGGVLLLAIPWRGKLSKVALGTALLYAPFLAFIDHFSHHYFLPLIGLATIAACASVAKLESEVTRKVLSWALVAVGAVLLGYSAVEGL